MLILSVGNILNFRTCVKTPGYRKYRALRPISSLLSLLCERRGTKRQCYLLEKTTGDGSSTVACGASRPVRRSGERRNGDGRDTKKFDERVDVGEVCESKERGIGGNAETASDDLRPCSPAPRRTWTSGWSIPSRRSCPRRTRRRPAKHRNFEVRNANRRPSLSSRASLFFPRTHETVDLSSSRRRARVQKRNA